MDRGVQLQQRIRSLFARVEASCWDQAANTIHGYPGEAHKVTQTLGGPLVGAPHATACGHCTDEYDLMCNPEAAGGVGAIYSTVRTAQA